MKKWESTKFAHCYCYERHGNIWMSLFGQRVRRSMGMKWNIENKKLAMKRLDYIAEQYSQKDYEDEKDITLEELIDNYRETKYPTSNKKHTQKLENAFDKYLTERDIRVIQTSYIETMIMKNVTHIKQQGINSINGIKKDLERLGQLFNYGIKRGFGTVNPARLINESIKAENIERDEFPADMIDATAEALNYNKQVQQLFLLIANTGIRINEALTIYKKDVSFTRKILKIEQGKGNRKRIFPITGRFAHLEPLLKEIVEANWHEEKLFSWYSAKSPRLHLRKTLKKLEIYESNMSFHSLRKLFINQMIDEDYPLRALAEIVGHSVIIMEKHYLKRRNAEQITNQAMKHITRK